MSAEYFSGDRFVKLDRTDATPIGTLTRPHMSVGVNALWVLLAERIAAKRWTVWQQRQRLPSLPDALPAGVHPYHDRPVFTPDNLPVMLRSTHTTKAGTWGLLTVHSGLLRYTLDDPPHTEVVLAAGQREVIPPEVRHHVAFELPGSFQITFCRTGSNNDSEQGARSGPSTGSDSNSC